jgi:hypothetical protein
MNLNQKKDKETEGMDHKAGSSLVGFGRALAYWGVFGSAVVCVPP